MRLYIILYTQDKGLVCNSDCFVESSRLLSPPRVIITHYKIRVGDFDPYFYLQMTE